MADSIKVATLDGGDAFDVYVAAPATTPAGAIIVIQEIFGVNAGIRAQCDALAGQGFLAAAPDLFWRIQRNVAISDKSEAEWKQAFGYYQQYNPDEGIKDIEALIKALRADTRCTGKVGVMGFCLGGHMAFLAATRTDADACVSYYGGGIDGRMNEAHAIARPLMLHLAVEDEYINADAQAKIHAALDGNARVTIHDYPGVQHAFARVDGVHRDDAAAALADARTLAFFKANLA